MVSVPPYRCNVCNIWIDSAAHWGSQSHIAMSKRKYSDPHDRGYSKPYHSPETPSSSTTTPGTHKIPQLQSTISQPRSSPASSRLPASDPNSIAPQYRRTNTSISRTQRTPSSSNIAPATRTNSQLRSSPGSSISPPTAPRNDTFNSRPQQPILPSAPQGFDNANFRSHRSSHHRGTPPTQPAPSITSPVRQNSNRTNPQRQSNLASSRPPELDPSTSPQYTRTDPSTSQNFPPSAPQGFDSAGLRSPRSSHQRRAPPSQSAAPNTSPGMRNNNNNPNTQPQSSPGSSRPPTSTASQYARTNASTSRIVSPSVSQGFDDANLRSSRSSHQRGTPPSHPAAPNTSTGMRNSTNTSNTQPQSSPSSLRPPTSTAPTDPSTSRIQHTVPQPRSPASSHPPEFELPSTSDIPFSIPPPTTGPQGSFCIPCATYIPFPAITSHLSPPTHIASCKTHGLFCVPCQKPFLNSFALRAHRETAEAHKIDPRLEDARREVGLYCEDCGETFQTRFLLRIHEGVEGHRGGRGSGGGGEFESQRIPDAAKVLGMRCEPAEQSIAESVIADTNTPARDENNLFCHDCRCIFGTPGELWFHHCYPPSSSPGPHPCSTCPRFFPTMRSRLGSMEAGEQI
ncbi:hypothetical protein BDD12DRAFT_829077 [Trichophaea hybrida]|nr:hypothetical protein BDD12DRAFT_829077 [Trichophaea hybrida]